MQLVNWKLKIFAFKRNIFTSKHNINFYFQQKISAF